MHEVVIVSDLTSLPLQGNVLKLVDTEAIHWHSFSKDIVDAVAIGFSLECEVVALVRSDLQANLHGGTLTSLSSYLFLKSF